MAKLKDREALENLRKSLQKKRRKDERRIISLCAGSGCGAYGTAKVRKALLEELDKQGLQDKVLVKLTGCHGFCEKGPIMVVHPEGFFYPQVKEEKIPGDRGKDDQERRNGDILGLQRPFHKKENPP